MAYYAYFTKDGKEPVGTDGCFILRDLKTLNGVRRRMRNTINYPIAVRDGESLVVFTFTSFFDEATFTQVFKESYA